MQDPVRTGGEWSPGSKALEGPTRASFARRCGECVLLFVVVHVLVPSVVPTRELGGCSAVVPVVPPRKDDPRKFQAAHPSGFRRGRRRRRRGIVFVLHDRPVEKSHAKVVQRPHDANHCRVLFSTKAPGFDRRLLAELILGRSQARYATGRSDVQSTTKAFAIRVRTSYLPHVIDERCIMH